ncbi:hypothetical protein HPP92_003900 [Vanilla planifolia]|uniref:Uncharacterized protein n=1 Tax=Vanilla planifolia TaxID=51239 RepID=A0A835VFX9_VANPL|nr:hypothetical protein HPP92_003900 [Vanilla planifolia]
MLLQPSTRARKSSCSPNGETFEGILNCFSTMTTCRGILRKISSKIVVLLLSHAFQACLSLRHDQKYSVIYEEKIGGTPLQISNSLISAFQNLSKVDERLELPSFEKQAFFTATAMVSQSS